MGELKMRTIRLPEFLRDLPPPLGYQGIRIEESKLNKIIFCLNIRDHNGKVYYPEVMWTIFHSIAGMNDDKVLGCEQITSILKLVKSKYKHLGKKVNLDSLCGNKYYRKEMTAIKYIQAMKILQKWRTFKNNKQKQKELNGKNDSPLRKTVKEQPKEIASTRPAPEPEPFNDMREIGYGPNAIREKRQAGIKKSIERNRLDAEEEQKRANRAANYVEESEQLDEPSYSQRQERDFMNLNHMEGNGHSLEESEDINLGASERNPMSPQQLP